MKIQAENKAHTPSYPVIAAVAAAFATFLFSLVALGGDTPKRLSPVAPPWKAGQATMEQLHAFFPHGMFWNHVVGDPNEAYSVTDTACSPYTDDEDLHDKEGFVIAPFNITEETPIIIIPSAEATITEHSITNSSTNTTEYTTELENAEPISESYSNDFAKFHQAICDGQFSKLVLAKEKTIYKQSSKLQELFSKICKEFPRAMVMMFETCKSGIWLIASPEILLDGKGRSLHTVALAGTMPFQEGHLNWSEKNKQEQHVVEEYIENILADASPDVLKDGPVSMRAGNLVHLRTDFRFHLAQGLTLGKLVQQLHPTPAVCGMPKFEATNFISEHEGLDRRYYSGFAGPVDIQGETHLYVSLRCAELSSSENGTDAVLYAGGGIMPGSECQSEWIETESKMKTIQNVLQ